MKSFFQINEFVKRARAAKIHAYIISHLKKEMPALMGKAKAQRKLMDNLENEFEKVRLCCFSQIQRSTQRCVPWLIVTGDFLVQIQREHHLPPGDFPRVEQFREVLSRYNIDDFEKLKPKMIQAVDDMLGYDIPELLKNFRNMYD